MATHADADLIIKLYDLRRESVCREARKFFGGWTPKDADEVKKVGSDPTWTNNAYTRQSTTYWEMAASLVNHGTLHRELFFESNQELLFLWVRIQELLPRLRELYQNPASLKNVEQLAGAFVEWWERRAPGAYASFAARINQIPPAPAKG